MGYWKNLRVDHLTGQLSQAVAESRLAGVIAAVAAKDDYVESTPLSGDVALTSGAYVDVATITLPVGRWQLHVTGTVAGVTASNADFTVAQGGASPANAVFFGPRSASMRIGAANAACTASVSPLVNVLAAGTVVLRMWAGATQQVARATTPLSGGASCTFILAKRDK